MFVEAKDIVRVKVYDLLGQCHIEKDANGDKVVNVADIVKLVKDGAPQSDIDAVLKIIMKN